LALGSGSQAFQLAGISYAYLGRHSALKEVDLDIGLGEQIVILGANGSGKSTLLKVLDGLVKPDAGRIEAFGEDITKIADNPQSAQRLHRKVGLVFQDADVQLFSPTVWDDVAFGPLQMGWSADEVKAHVDEALEIMGVAGIARRAPYELSGGEKKRVAIATVLSLDPEVLLLDEPTANLDPRSKAVLVDLIARFGSQGKTVVTATHELEIVPTVASRAVVFSDVEHRPVASGPVESILGDDELLIRANLIHEHLHYHGRQAHAHAHEKEGEHHRAPELGSSTQ
jgi:cobalt/nickel transport system ATP-binding protein